MVDTSKCPCSPNKSYNECCRPLLEGQRFATTAEELMRSRYTAYVKKRKDYLVATWHPSTREVTKDLEFENGLRWLGLKIVNTEAGHEGDSKGRVEFVASYTLNGGHGQVVENSRFLKEDGRWYYLDAIEA